MAKKKVTYICEVCELEYNKEEVANNCEKAHYVADKITKHNYAKTKPEFPESINVVLKNKLGKEKTITFYRERSRT